MVGQTLLASSSNTKLTTILQTSDMEDDHLDPNQWLHIVLPRLSRINSVLCLCLLQRKTNWPKNKNFSLMNWDFKPTDLPHPSQQDHWFIVIIISWNARGLVSMTGKRGLSPKGRSSNTTLPLSSSKRLIPKTSTYSLSDSYGALDSLDRLSRGILIMWNDPAFTTFDITKGRFSLSLQILLATASPFGWQRFMALADTRIGLHSGRNCMSYQPYVKTAGL